MIRKIIGILLCCLLIIGFVPVWAFAATPYPLWIGEVQVTDENCNDVLGDGGSVAVTPYGSYYYIYLRGANITKGSSHVSGVYDGIYCGDPSASVTIYARDSSISLTPPSGYSTARGIAAKNLNIYVFDGTFAIDVKAGTTGSGDSACGIEGGDILLFSSPDCELNISSEDRGIAGSGDIQIDVYPDAKLNIASGTMTGCSGEGISTIGRVSISNDGDVSISSGSAYSIASVEAQSVRLFGDGNYDIKSENVGIEAFDDVEIEVYGSVSIEGEGHAVALMNSGKKLRVGGSVNPLTLECDPASIGLGGSPVINVADLDKQPFDFDSDYSISGNPDTDSLLTAQKLGYLTVGSTVVDDSNKDDVFSDGTVKYDSAAKKLYLNNANITDKRFNGMDAMGIYSPNDLTVSLEGANKIELADDSSAGYMYGMYCHGDLRFEGDGTLDIVCGSGSFDSFSVMCAGMLYSDADGAVTIDTTLINYSNGMRANKGILISGDGDLTVSAMDVGIYSKSGPISIKGKGNVTVNSTYDSVRAEFGIVDISGKGNVTAGSTIYAYKDLTVLTSDASQSIQVISPDGACLISDEGGISLAGPGSIVLSSVNSGGIYTNVGDIVLSNTGDVNIESCFDSISSGGDVRLYGTGNVKAHSTDENAIYAFETCTIDADGNIELITDTADSIYANGDVTVSGTGDLSVTSPGSDGIYTEAGDVVISGSGNVTVISGNNAIGLYGTGKELKLEGSSPVIELDAPTAYAVHNYSDNTSPVGGSTLGDYTVTGAPDSAYCKYELTAPVYTITVLTDGNGTAAADYSNAAAGTAVALVTTPNAGFHFKGWDSADVTVSGNTFTMPAKDVSVKAMFEADGSAPVPGDEDDVRFTLSFNTNGGSSIPKLSLSEASTVQLSGYRPSKEGASFAGWYSDKDLTREISSVKMIKDTVVYAKWNTETKPVSALPFDDVSSGSWSYDDIRFVYENGLMDGTASNVFAPARSTSRGMIVTILFRLDKASAAGLQCPFGDVRSGSYYEGPISWAAANGIVEGYGNGKFGPDDAITREQLAVILYNYAKYKGYDVSASAGLEGFTDSGEVSSYAKQAMSWAVGSGLMEGSSGRLVPKGSATREQAAALIHRYCEKIAK